MGHLEADIIPVMPLQNVPAAQQNARSDVRASWGGSETAYRQSP